MLLVCLVFLTLASTLIDCRPLQRYVVNPEEMGGRDDIMYPSSSARFRRQIAGISPKWDKNYIPFEIGNGYSRRDVNNILEAIRTIERYTCLVFRRRSLSDTDYLYYTNENHVGCASFVGRVGGKQEINLDTPGCTGIDAILHETFHALGFWHEISRLDRDNYITINYEYIQKGQEYNFGKKPSWEMDISLPYDYSSIMHYSPYAFSKDGHHRTIEPKIRGVHIGEHDGLSRLDIDKLNVMYNCYDQSGNFW